MSSFFLAHKRSILFGSIGVAIGALGGFLYWKYVGCIDGTCAIWSNPTKSTVYGALMGGLFLLAFVPETKKSDKS
jgi:hypothetical protein